MEPYGWHTVELHQTLLLREYLFTLFHTLLGSAPEKDFLCLATSPKNSELVRIAFADQGESSERIAETFITELENAKANLEDTALEYTHLFIGPGRLPVYPWESVFRSEDSILFTQKTLEVRNAYYNAGFRPTLSPHIADDHIALEFGFIATLSHQACVAYEEHNDAAFDAILTHTKTFIDQHMLKWVPSYMHKVIALGQFPVYSAILAAASRFLEIDRNMLEETNTLTQQPSNR